MLLSALLLELAESSVCTVFVFNVLSRCLPIQVVGYRDDPDLQVLIDTMQESWHCCGINGADDWDRNTYFSIAAREVGIRACETAS